MALCEKCQPITIDYIRDNMVQHHSSLQALKLSAEAGCHLCNLFWTCLYTTCGTEFINMYLKGMIPLEYGSKPGQQYKPGDTSIRINGLIMSDMIENEPIISGYIDHTLLPRNEIWVYSGNEENDVPSSMGTSVFGRIDVYAEYGTIAAKTIRGRYASYADPRLRSSFFKERLENCHAKHRKCGGIGPSLMPTRVIDVGDPSKAKAPSLFITNGALGHYIALSYSWGEGVRHKIQLLRTTLLPFQEKIDEASMTQAHRDALQIAREFGVQYIWIDALCIIQKDPVDWDQEAMKMSQIYGNAYLTLVAGGSDSSLGFLNHGYQPKVPPCALEYSRPRPDENKLGYCYAAIPRVAHAGVVETRAWCFQESELSRKKVVFGREQLVFGCQEETCTEDGLLTAVDWGQGLWTGGILLSGLASSEMTTNKSLMLRKWYKLLEDYEERDLWDPNDIFPALSGIAQRVQKALGCRYLAGLWEDDMIRGLLWRTRQLRAGPFSKTPLKRPYFKYSGKSVVRAPSWSWAAVEGPLWHLGIATAKHDEDYRNPDNIRCFPLDRHTQSWTKDISNAEMPRIVSVQLDVCGVLRRVHCSNFPISKCPRSWLSKSVHKSLPPARINMRCTPLESADSKETGIKEAVVALGIFDIAEEKVDTFWCMPVISQEGLMLRKDMDNKYHRLGIFIIVDEEWFKTSSLEHVMII